MKFAPVIIPTLNRFDHLKKCVDSLNSCHNAEQTEVYISIDYPPSEKYRDGYKKICEYLESGHFCFKKLHVIKQTQNRGVVGDNCNAAFLRKLIMQSYDRWIFSEDDNFFAPGFIDFMNEVLEKFQNDKTVFSVCGYRFYYNLKIGNNNYLRQQSDFNAWGCGYWRDKYETMLTKDVGYLRRIIYNPMKVIKIWKVSNMQLSHLTGLSKKTGFKRGDNFLTIYMIDQGMTQIMPSKSMVRNMGWDELGQNCIGFPEDVINKHINQEIDDNAVFEGLNGTGWEYYTDNKKVIRDEDFQRCSFNHAFYVYIKRLLGFWK